MKYARPALSPPSTPGWPPSSRPWPAKTWPRSRCVATAATSACLPSGTRATPSKKLTPSDLGHFRQYLSRDRGLKPASVNRKLQALRRFCRWALATGKLQANVAAQLKLARAARGTRPKGLIAAEVQSLLRAAGQSRRALARRNYALLQLLLQAGLRVSEAAALRIEDLEIRERHGKVRTHGKGNKERYVPLNATARRALQAYLDEREETSLHDPLFLSDTGTRWSVRAMQWLITQLARRAHLTRIPVSAHTLRHTFALGYLQQNPGKLVELATLLGHESLDTTALYALPSGIEVAGEVLDLASGNGPEILLF